MLSMQENFSDPQVQSFVYMVFRDWTGFNTEDMLKFDGRGGEESANQQRFESLEVSRVDGSSIYKLVPKNSIS